MVLLDDVPLGEDDVRCSFSELEWWNAKRRHLGAWWVIGVANWCGSFLRKSWKMAQTDPCSGFNPWPHLLLATALVCGCVVSIHEFHTAILPPSDKDYIIVIWFLYNTTPPKTLFNQNKSLISAPKTPFNNSRVDRGVGSSPLRSTIWPIWSWSRWKKCPVKPVGHFVFFFTPSQKVGFFGVVSKETEFFSFQEVLSLFLYRF